MAMFRPPPGAGSQPFDPVPPRQVPPASLRWLPYLFGAGAIFWLVELAQWAAIVAAPAGRDRLRQGVVQAGATGGEVLTWIAIEIGVGLFFLIAAASLHAAAYFGLRRRKPWGWIVAVIVAAAWSLVLVGIPVLVVLVRSSTRRAYEIP
jgi:hypothetical protein